MAIYALQPRHVPNNPEADAEAGFQALQTLHAIFGHDGASTLIDALLERMDALDGDSDFEGVENDGLSADDEPDADTEDGDVDCCGAGDDNVPDGQPGMYGDGRPGDPEDAEAEHDNEHPMASWATFGGAQ